MKVLSVSISAGFPLLVCLTAALASETEPASLEFFEKEIRPLLANHCYECHSAETATPFAGLRLDRRDDLIKGGVSGPAIVAGKPDESPLIHRVQGRPALMPPTGALSDAQIQSLIEWVRMGAPWTDPAAASADSGEEFHLEARKRSHWAWQPVRSVSPPPVNDATWPLHPMDRFILARLEQEGLEPAPAADRHTLIRRLSYDLRGLPPLPGEVQAFVADPSPRAYEALVDDYLDSPHFGEHWARHWMDLVRYSESHGSEGDPDTPYAWRYRDYLIRALNADIPYNQLIREHLAGDLLPSPRMNPALGINESLLATAHFRMVEHGFQPVDPLEDRIKWTDNQVDVLSKAFQGLTISCARCHDHKFDAISQEDYYAIFGVLYGARPTQRAVDDPERLDWGRNELTGLKEEIRQELAGAWIREASALSSKLLETPHEAFTNPPDSPCKPASSPDSSDDPAAPETAVAAVETDEPKGAGTAVSAAGQALNQALEEARCEPGSPLAAWVRLAGQEGDDFRQEWAALKEEWDARIRTGKAFNREHFQVRWDLSGPDYGEWIGHGAGLPAEPSRPGEFSVGANRETDPQRHLPRGGLHPSPFRQAQRRDPVAPLYHRHQFHQSQRPRIGLQLRPVDHGELCRSSRPHLPYAARPQNGPDGMGSMGRGVLEGIHRVHRVGHPGRCHQYLLRPQEVQNPAGRADGRAFRHRSQPDSVSRDEGDAQRNASVPALSAPGRGAPLTRRSGPANGPSPGGSHRSLEGRRSIRASGRVSGRVRSS